MSKLYPLTVFLESLTSCLLARLAACPTGFLGPVACRDAVPACEPRYAARKGKTLPSGATREPWPIAALSFLSLRLIR